MLRKQCLLTIKTHTNDYQVLGDKRGQGVVKPRDIGCLVSCYARMLIASRHHLALSFIALKQDASVNLDAFMKQETSFIDGELRTLAKRAALAMGSMTDKGREFVRDQFAAVDFYDKDLTEALLKYNLVKGAGKK